VAAPALRVNTTCSVATGDIDLDGRPEIVACDTTGNRLVAFEHDGTFKWRTNPLETINWGSPSIADLNQDGTPEIIIGRQALDNAGVLLWTGTCTSGGGLRVSCSQSDIDVDGSPEVVPEGLHNATGGRLSKPRSS
jgi:hypothetical protein